MKEKMFILGRPGSGKSSLASLVEMLIRDSDRDNHWIVKHINDYELLQQMFLYEEEQNIPLRERKFRPSGPEEYNGFDVVDFSVLSTVLKTMEGKASDIEKDVSPEENLLIIIEFARADYTDALQQFSKDFLQNAHFFYLDVDMERCIPRIHKRIAYPRMPNDHFVSDDIMRTYYSKDDWLQVSSSIQKPCYTCVNTQETENGNLPWSVIHAVEQIVATLSRNRDQWHEEDHAEDVSERTTEPLEVHVKELVDAAM